MQPISTLTIDGLTDKVELLVFAETEWLAITSEVVEFQITHKPSGMKIPRSYARFSTAKAMMKKLEGVDWNWGAKWSAKTKRRMSLSGELSGVKDADKAKAALLEARRIVEANDR